MKKLKFLGVAAAAGLVLLTSCMKGDNTYSNTTFGIIDYPDFSVKKLVYTYEDYPLSITNIENDLEIEIGNVLYFAYTVDREAAENLNVATNGYQVATYNGSAVLNENDFFFMLQDTTTVRPGELLLKDAQFASAVIKTPQYEKVVLSTTIEKMLTDQKNRYTLSCNQSEPDLVDGNRVYTWYLRCEKIEDGKAPTLNPGGDLRAFNIQSFMSSARYQEKAAEKKQVNIRIAYPKTFNSDSTKIASWGMSQILPMPIIEDK